MVMPGQFLERPTLIDLGGRCLEALWHRGDARPALLILAPHPHFGGGSMDAPLCLELAFAATRRGHPTLRFNWRGVSASQGQIGGLAESLDDARQALAALAANVHHGEIAVAGYGFGAEVACALARSREMALAGLFLIAPDEARCPLDQLDQFDQLGHLTTTAPCLVLPESDWPLDAALGDRLAAAGVALEVIPGADRSFTEGLVQAGAAVARRLGELGAPGRRWSAPTP